MKLQNIVLAIFVLFLAMNLNCCAYCTDPPPRSWRGLPLNYCETGPYYERCFYGWNRNCVVSREVNGVCSIWEEERGRGWRSCAY